MKVFIATPTAGGIVKSKFAETLVGNVVDLKNRGISANYLTFDGSDIVLARNYMATMFLRNKKATHLFFIDSDMAFKGDLCHRLIETGKPIVGAVYPRRNIDQAALQSQLEDNVEDINAALAFSMSYIVKLGTSALDVKDGLCRVQGIGAGALLIKRQVFEEMINSGVAKLKPANKQSVNLGISEGIYDFFDPIYTNGNYLSEDLSFCHRWVELCKKELWALVNEDVGHVGDMRYGVPYIHRLKQGLS